MYFSENIPLFSMFFFLILAVILRLLRTRKVMKKHNYHISDAYGDLEIGKKIGKEVEHKFYLYWILIILGFVSMIVLALINKQ